MMGTVKLTGMHGPRFRACIYARGGETGST